MQVSLQHCSYAKAHCMHAHTIQQSYMYEIWLVNTSTGKVEDYLYYFYN